MKTDFIYLQVYNKIKDAIETGKLKPGDKLPPEYQLQEQNKVSRDTIRKSLAKLEQNGYITRKAAIGTFVNHKKADYTLLKMKSFTEQMYDRGVEPSSEILSIELFEHEELPSEVPIMLEVQEHKKIYKICRIRKANAEPMAFEIVFLPYALCPEIQTHLNAKASLYRIYEQYYKHHIGYLKISLDAEIPSAFVQKKLSMDSTTPVLTMRGTGYLESSIPLYYVTCHYAADRYTFSTQLAR